jgi:hypothetical protein
VLPVFAVTVALLAQAAAGVPPPSSPPAPAAAQKPTATNVICRSEENTGSRFSHRVCHTPQEWQAISTQAGDSVSKMQQMGGMTGGPH